MLPDDRLKKNINKLGFVNMVKWFPFVQSLVKRTVLVVSTSYWKNLKVTISLLDKIKGGFVGPEECKAIS